MTSAGTTWSGSYTFRASEVHHPRTIDEVQELVARAPRIRALGSRHSFSGMADSAELVSLDGLPADIRVDAETETVSFNAGLRYGELATALQAQGWALRNMASLPHISVGGAIATATHGSGDRNGTLARSVCGLELVTATGELTTIGPIDEFFDGCVVGLGALGVVTRITLDIEPTFDVRQDVHEGLTWPRLLENFDAIMGRGYSVSVFTDWVGESVRVWLKSVVGGQRPPGELYDARPAAGERHPLEGMDAASTTPQRGVPGPWLDRLPHFRLDFTPSNGNELQTEYFVPRTRAVEAIEAVRALGAQIAPLLYVSELRSIAADSLWLSGAYERDAVGIHFTWKFEPDAVNALLPTIEEALAPFGARPHWGKVFHSVDRDLYPRLADFAQLAERLDPNRTFGNEWLDQHVL